MDNYDLIVELANKGNCDGQYKLGYYYCYYDDKFSYERNKPEEDYKRAVFWYS
jgi:TPR repeat protein